MFGLLLLFFFVVFFGGGVFVFLLGFFWLGCFFWLLVGCFLFVFFIFYVYNVGYIVMFCDEINFAYEIIVIEHTLLYLSRFPEKNCKRLNVGLPILLFGVGKIFGRSPPILTVTIRIRFKIRVMFRVRVN